MAESVSKSGSRSAWGWRPRRDLGIWKYGPAWARPFTAAVPWLTVGLLVLLFSLVDGRPTAAPGVVFDLPRGNVGEDDVPTLVALMIPVPRDVAGGEETLVYFDDARYTLSDSASAASLASRLEQRASAAAKREILLLADRRVPGGEVMRFVGLARGAGISRVQVAEKNR